MILLDQEQEIRQIIARFESQSVQGHAVAQLELLVRTAVFKSGNQLVGWLLQQAVDRVDAAYQPQGWGRVQGTGNSPGPRNVRPLQPEP